jgi:hypothetical protein
MDVRARWEASAIVSFRLPSGFIVSGIWPSLTDLARRGALPFELRKAVLLAAGKTGKKGSKVTQDDESRTLEQRQRVTAYFVRGIYDDETGEWQRLRLTFEELTDGAFPGDDIETLDTFAFLAMSGNVTSEQAAAKVHEIVERNLFGDAAVVEEEAGDTVDDLAAFRDKRRGGAPDGPGVDVAPAAERLPAGIDPAAGLPRRRRTRAAPAA